MTLLARFLAAFMPKTKPNSSESKTVSVTQNFTLPSKPTTPSLKGFVLSDFFSFAELRCKGVKCGCGNKVILDPTFERELLKLRLKLNLPMIPTSCCRCKVHNKREGGKAMSFHISDFPAWEQIKGTAAIDVKYTDTTYRNTLARLAYELGWRIGYNRHFLHLDIAHIAGVKALPTFFKYDNVSDAELAAFKKQIIGR